MQNSFTQFIAFLKRTHLLSVTEKTHYAGILLDQGYFTEKQKAALGEKLRARMAQ